MVILLSEFPSNIMHIIGAEGKIEATKNQNTLRITTEVNVKETVLYKYISSKCITEEKVDLLKG